MQLTEEQKKWRTRLDCPLCGARNTRFNFSIKKMICEKCGHTWERPLYEKG